MNMIEKVDLTKAYYLQHLITEHYQECMDEWYKKCKFKKDKEVEMKKVEKYIREIIKTREFRIQLSKRLVPKLLTSLL